MITVDRATEKDIREFADNIRYMDDVRLGSLLSGGCWLDASNSSSGRS